MSNSSLTTEEFLSRFEYQFKGSQVLAYFVILPLFSFLIFFPTIGGLLQRQRFVFYGFMYTVVLMAWAFGLMGYGLGWIEDSKVESCSFEFEGLQVDICFCELYQTFQSDIDVEETLREERLSQLVIQPSAVLSNMAFIASGMLCLFIGSYPLKRIKSTSRVHKFIADIRDNGNPMSRENSKVSLVYGLVVIFIGPASMIYHASIRQWAGIIDVVGILVWASYCVAYSASQLFFHDTEFHRDEHTFNTMSLLIVLFIFLATVAICWYIGNGQFSSPLYAVYIGGLIILEFTVQYYEYSETPYNGVKRDTKWLAAAIGSILGAVAIWAPGGGVLNVFCPSYWPHALWHILAAATTFFMYLYYCSEIDLQEIKQGRVRARSVRTKRLQEDLGFNFEEAVLQILEDRRRNQKQDPADSSLQEIVVDLSDVAVVKRVASVANSQKDNEVAES